MVRGIAASYGHRPTAATTIHLLRRLVLEAGKLGAVDIASTSLVQHLGGAVTERLATSAADALYASYRMARLGIIVMDLCRPIPFAQDDVPSVASLVGNVLRRRSDPAPLPELRTQAITSNARTSAPAGGVQLLNQATPDSMVRRGARWFLRSFATAKLSWNHFPVEAIVMSGRE